MVWWPPHELSLRLFNRLVEPVATPGGRRALRFSTLQFMVALLAAHVGMRAVRFSDLPAQPTG